MKPSVGRIVHVYHPDVKDNGASFAPAIITRVWSDDCINVTAFPDCGTQKILTSLLPYHFGNEVDGEKVGWAWPPRVE